MTPSKVTIQLHPSYMVNKDRRELPTLRYLRQVHQEAEAPFDLQISISPRDSIERGKTISRDKLITVLEGFYQFQTGLTPPLTYGPNRRVGALGSYIVMVDLEQRRLVPASGWIVPR